ncbi:MAG TPA: RNase A-like domain-containing protein [Pyrinomonadaceae bacterium]|jgi:hypothetical protein
MANPVNNSGINAQVSVGGALKANVNAGGAARRISDTQSKDIFESVNENYTKNPNHSRPAEQAGDADQSHQNQVKAGNNSAPPGLAKDVQEEHAAPPAPNKRTKNADIGEGAALLKTAARGENGDVKSSRQGILNGRGQQKSQVPPEPVETPPIVILPTDTKGNQTTIETPPIIAPPNGNGNHGGPHNNAPGSTVRNPRINNQNAFGTRFSVDLSLRANGNQPTGVIRNVVNQILRQNDVYLSHNTLNRLISSRTFNNSTRGFNHPAVNLPREVNQLFQTVSRRALSLLDNSRQNHKLIHEISKEIGRELRENVQASKAAIFKTADLRALHFKHLNINEKMEVAVDLLPQHLPEKALAPIQHHQPREVLDAFLLARGLIVPSEKASEIRNLLAAKSSVLPPAISMTALRDVGQLVKTLIADTAAAKTTANLDSAVQKFVKILLANNELGVLLATISLVAQTTNESGLVSRSLALAQIYELINQLIPAGEKALGEAAPEKNILQKERNIFHAAPALSAVDDTDESRAQINKLHAQEATAGSLRQFLEFNPALVYDKSASAFHNPDDARQARDNFINLHHDDLLAWLESGNHRFVKDFDFDKPVGVVVERGSESVFTATTARFVLVRDGSVQGWHFLKSFLVK